MQIQVFKEIKEKTFKLAPVLCSFALVGAILPVPALANNITETMEVECINTNTLKDMFECALPFTPSPYNCSFRIMSKNDVLNLQLLFTEEELLELLENSNEVITFCENEITIEVDKQELEEKLKQAKQDRINQDKRKNIIINIFICAGIISIVIMYARPKIKENRR